MFSASNFEEGTTILSPLPLWALHLADGVLTAPWVVGGFAIAGMLACIAAWRLREEDVPQVALLTAAFFVVSLIHVRVGPTSVHLLINGLLGVVLGWRAALAIPIGLALQVILVGHGGFTTLGVNSCALTIPALLVGITFRNASSMTVLRSSTARALLTGLSSALWILSTIFVVTLLVTNPWRTTAALQFEQAVFYTFHPVTLAALLFVTGALAWGQHRWQQSSEHVLGLLLGELSVLLAAGLNCAVLALGGVASWNALALLVLLAHLPLAVLEGLVLGFTISFLAKVKPEMIGLVRSGFDGESKQEGQSVACPEPATSDRLGDDTVPVIAFDAADPGARSAGQVQSAFGSSSSD